MINSEWDIGFKHRGLGHGDFGVIVKETQELVVECPSGEIAEHIVLIHNEWLMTSSDNQSIQ